MTGPFAELRLRSGQVLLRAYRIADARWYVNARDETIFQWTTERRTLTVAETEAAILRVNDAADAVCLLIVDAGSDEPFGNLALSLDLANQAGEISYWLAPAARRRGVATEAVTLLSRWAFATLNLQRIYLKTMVGNVASQRVAQRAGYQPIASPKPQDEGWVWFECKATDVELLKQDLSG